MSITTYAELQTAVASWLHRTDLTTTIPDFIRLAESRINKALKTKGIEKTGSLTATVGLSTIALPSDYNKPIALRCTFYTPGKDEIRYRERVKIDFDTNSNYPTYWTIYGDYIVFDCPADQAYTFEFDYYGSLTLSDSATTNWLLTNYPDVYLYGALLQAAPYLQDDARITVWSALYQAGLDQLQIADDRGSTSGGALLTRAKTFG